MKKPALTNLWRKLLLAAVSFCVALLVMEIAFRIADIHGSYHQAHSHEFIRDPQGPIRWARFGFVPLSTNRTYYYTDPRDYFGPSAAVDHNFNSAGWRDEEHSIAKPAGEYRILGLGDSYLMGQGVHAEDAFFSQLETLLNQAGLPSEIETINTGISGNNTVHQAQMLLSRGLAYDPDLVIVNFVPNDVEQNLESDEPLIEFYRNYTRITQQPDWLSNYSYLWSWARQRILQHIVARRYINESLASFDRTSEKWNVCRNALLKIVETCRQHNVPVMVAVFPFFHELNGDYPFQPVHDRVDNFCHENQVPVLDLREVYRDYSGPELWVHPTDQHPNEIAHRLAAEAMAAFILEHRKAFQIGERPSPSRNMADEPQLQAMARIFQLDGIIDPKAKFLSFEGIPLPDGDLRLMESYWAHIPDINWLSLRKTRIGDSSLPMLLEKRDWVGIDLSFTQVTSDGVSKLAPLKQLNQLGLEQTNIDDAAIKPFAEHPSLQVLNLAGTHVTNASVDTLLSMPKLETLVVSDTKLDEAAILRLAEIPTLKALAISSNQISQSAQKEINERHPKLAIVIQNRAAENTPP